MTEAASHPGLGWTAARLVRKAQETPRAATLELDVRAWPRHRAGQHVDLRLTAEDGYQAQRSYSIASAPESQRLALTVERIEDGEVSPYLVDEMDAGDVMEVRGPIGGWFAWSAVDGGPLFLVGGGSGLVPLMAMLRHRVASGRAIPVRLLVSARTPDDVLYASELDELAAADGIEVTRTLTRHRPPDWTGYDRRVDREMLSELGWPPDHKPRTFVCGPTAFVEAVAGALVELGHDPATVKTERFGPTGGGSG